MKRWKGEKAKVQQQMVYTVSEGSIPVPAVLIGQKGKLHLRAALEAERVRNGIILRRASSKGRRSTIRLPYGRITITNEGRGRIGYRR